MSSPKPAAPPVPSPSNPVLIARQSQWIFTDSELYRTPSVLDGMEIETEHMLRSKGANFITQVGVLLKLPQLTLSTAGVYLHRFFMRHSMVDLPQRQGIHPYSIAATSLFLATKVEENCRKMKELIVACCRVALKQPNLVVDEQSKEFWKWRDTILHNEDLLLEALCFDLQLEQPYRLLYDFLCYFRMQDDKRLRNAAWAFVNDSTFSVLCVQFHARTIAAAALYAAARHCEAAFEDDSLGRPWWQQIDADLSEIRRACDRMAELYEKYPLQNPGLKYPASPMNGEQEQEAAEKTRQTNRHQRASEEGLNHSSASMSRSPADSAGTKRERGEISDTSPLPLSTATATNGAAHDIDSGERSPKRRKHQASEEGEDANTEPNSSSSFSQTQQPPASSNPSFVQATSTLNIASSQKTEEGSSRDNNDGSNNTTTTTNSGQPPPPPPPPADGPEPDTHHTNPASTTHMEQEPSHHSKPSAPSEPTEPTTTTTTTTSSSAQPPEQSHRPSRIPSGAQHMEHPRPPQQQRVPGAYHPSSGRPPNAHAHPPPSAPGRHIQR